MNTNSTFTIQDLLDTFPDEPYERGKEFEHLCEWYLENSPEYRRQIKKVTRPAGRDTGIDLEAETHDGQIWAVQCKAYDQLNSVSKKDIDSFLSRSNTPRYSFRLLIASTNRIGTNARQVMVLQEKPIGRILLSDLNRSQVDWSAWKESRQLDPVAPKTPREIDQLPAVEDVVKGLSIHDRGQLIMACGTGKTLVAMWAFEKIAPQRTLVLAPSISLIAQNMREWTSNSTADFNYLPVCSDPTVEKKANNDQSVSSLSEFGHPTTTNPDEIAAFLSEEGNRVIFSTYQSSMQVAKAINQNGLKFDLVIADEAHHCAGNVESEFSAVLDDQFINADKRLFMTATPRIFTGRVIKRASEQDLEIASMDDETKFGPVLHRLNFGEAIEKGVLSDYQIVVIGVTDKEVAEQVENRELMRLEDNEKAIDAKSLGAQIGLLRAFKKHGIKRTISFHSRISKAKEFAAILPETSQTLTGQEQLATDIWSKHISGKMTSDQRDELMEDFAAIEDKPSLLSNARCLGEGVDVPSIDGVAFIDPKRSQIAIVQAVGRAIRKSDEDKIGTVIIPVFIDTNQEPEEILENSDFKDIWAVVKALRDHDSQLGEEIDQLRIELGRTGQLVGPRPQKLSFDLPVSVEIDFIQAFDTRLIEMTSEDFNVGIGTFKKYVARKGYSSKIPIRYKEGVFNLGLWVNKQNIEYANKKLSQDHIDKLEAIPEWKWLPIQSNLNEFYYQNGFDSLKRYVAREGHSRVPARYKDGDIDLGTWVRNRRIEKAEGTLTRERIEQLESIQGWRWSLRKKTLEWFIFLKQYANRERHTNIDLEHIEDSFPLGKFVRQQRIRYKNADMSQQRIDQLESIPEWTWDISDLRVRAGYKKSLLALKQYVAREGHARVPSKHKEGDVNLGSWVKHRRSEYRKATLSEEHIRQLEILPGWVWDAQKKDLT